MSSIRFLVASFSVQGRTVLLTLTSFPSTSSTWKHMFFETWRDGPGEINAYLDLSVLLSIHLNHGVLPSVGHKFQSVNPFVLRLVFKLLFKVLDSVLQVIKRKEFALSYFPLNCKRGPISGTVLTKAVLMLRDCWSQPNQALLHVEKTYHPAPSVPWIEPVVFSDHLNDVELVIVMSDVCLIEHAVIVFMHLMRHQALLEQRTPWKLWGESFLTSPDADREQCSSTFLLTFTCGPAAKRASLVEVKASFGSVVSSFAFFPPALAAAVALLFGAMILFENPSRETLMMNLIYSWTSSDMPFHPPSPRINKTRSIMHITLFTEWLLVSYNYNYNWVCVSFPLKQLFS